MLGFIVDINGQPLRCGVSTKDDAFLLSVTDLKAINGDAGLHKIVTRGHHTPGMFYSPLGVRVRITYATSPITEAAKLHSNFLLKGTEQLVMLPWHLLDDHVSVYGQGFHDYTLLKSLVLPHYTLIAAECDAQLGYVDAVGRALDELEGTDSSAWVTYRSQLGKRRRRAPSELVAL